ncbi:uncharacterized protein LOC111891205 [Lactuca sativa]|uniref:uncharacterized protein LOC111891205 n=1 Tax=Lactuca sativa TaxID=4236 RepID=UPI0022B0474B|nr:uncharacterized protein LOC111891205 [Lactuca sativa]
MALNRPFMITLYWGDNVEYENGIIKGDESTMSASDIIRQKIRYEQFQDLAYALVGVEKSSYKLNMSLCYQYSGRSNIAPLINDSTLDMLYYLAMTDENYWGQVCVEIEKIVIPTNTSLVDLLHNFEVPFPLPSDDRFEPNNEFGFDDPNSECSSESLSHIEEDSDDVSDKLVVDFMNDVGNIGDDVVENLEDNVHIDVWKETENKIRLGMQFESKQQVKNVVILWSISQNREFKVYEIKHNKWVAKCKTEVGEGESSSSMHHTQPCQWYIRAIKKKNNHMWQITRWVDEHNCFGSCISNNSRILNSRVIASYILHSIQKDVAYPVKHVQADIKNRFHVDVSYWKAWHGKRKAIETIYGTWESNFVELHKYIAALQASNPDTIVKPAIKAFHLCRPVISIDGAHLKGSYKGKLLVAASKDANNNILPISYAIVDEETVHSWCWFLGHFRNFVAPNRQLCVLSDRHKGIIHAMENLEEWKEPLAYHRFCLRHVRSNLMKRYKNVNLKKICWSMGSTTQKRKFAKYIREIKAINMEAWQYLKEIKRSQWCLLYDENHRWGFLTTNISESMNNALRGARQLPIRACINLTFNRTMQLFRKHSGIAMNCITPLPKCMWRLFLKRDTRAQSHVLSEFHYNEGVYRVVTRSQINGTGGNTQTVNYFQHMCTCGKWQMERFPCSHALAVCRNRGDNPLSIVNNVYTTMTYRQQYNFGFVPLPHVDYWLDSNWTIEADYSKLSVHRGRRRANRIHNEMDICHPDEPRRCTLCHQPGHNRRNCSNSQQRFNE